MNGNSVTSLAAALALAVASAAGATSARAAPIAVLAPVTIDPLVPVRAVLGQKCHLDAQLQDDIVEGLKRFDPEATTTTDAGSGRVLRVAIIDSFGWAGGGYVEAKTISVKAEYLQDGQVAFTAQVHYHIGRSAFHDNCWLLQRLSKTMGRSLGKWAQAPRNVMEPGSTRVPPTPVEPEASAAED